MFVAANIRYLRRKFNLSQDDLAKQFDYDSFTTIQKWESSVSMPPLDKFVRMAEMFNVNLDDFALKDLSAADGESYTYTRTASIPIYGKIPAGVPIEAIEDVVGSVELSAQMTERAGDYFALLISGKSMEPKYKDGDIVIFEKANDCESGDECAVIIGDGDATFKKVKKAGKSVTLQPLNPEYDPIKVDITSAAAALTIIGIAREVRRKV